MFFEFNEFFHVISSFKLEFEQEQKLLQILRERTGEIGLTLVGILGISLSTCMHQILIEDEAKAERQSQRQLNLLIWDVVKNEFYIAPKDKENTIFSCPLDTFNYRRMLFNPEIKNEDTHKIFKVNGHCHKLFHESPTLEEEIVEELSLRNATYTVICPP